METLITLSDILFFGLLILSPIILLNFLKKKSPKRIAVKFILIGLFLMALLIFVMAVWTDISNLLLLNHFGYSVDGMNYENVLPENRERVDKLATSIMGIGWPLKAMFGFVMAIPYLMFVYFGKKLLDEQKERKNKA
jgi:uncharacterized protein YqhQ